MEKRGDGTMKGICGRRIWRRRRERVRTRKRGRRRRLGRGENSWGRWFVLAFYRRMVGRRKLEREKGQNKRIRRRSKEEGEERQERERNG